MEKFSKWRDSSTGLAPFVYPLPPLSGDQLPSWITIPLIPLALFRTIVLISLAISYTTLNLLIDLGLAKIVSNRSRCFIRSIVAKVFGRLSLYLFGFTSLPNEIPFTIKTPTLKVLGQHPIRPGEIIMSNWSSYIEIIYLTYLYDPIFLIPIPSKKDTKEVKAFMRRSTIDLVTLTGQPPVYFEDLKPSSKTLSQNDNNVSDLAGWIKTSKEKDLRPIVIFPEGTTSNNRALLKFPNLNSESIGQIDEDLNVFFIAFRHEQPSRLRSSITVPIPTSPLNLPHIISSNKYPIILIPPILRILRSIIIKTSNKTSLRNPNDYEDLDGGGVGLGSRRSFNVRYLKKSSPMKIRALDLFEVGSSVIVKVGKFKVTNQIFWIDKLGFLNYLKSRR